MKANETIISIYSVTVTSAASYCIGLIGWNSGINGFCLMAMLPGLWLVNKSRLSAFFVILSYYCGACHELFYGAQVYFDHGRALNFLFWFLHQVILASGWIIFWKKGMDQFWEILLRLCLTYLVTVFIPPYSLIGIAHPVTAAGFFFPGTGITGILLFIYLSALCGYLFIKVKNELFYNVSKKVLTRMIITIVAINLVFVLMSNLYAHLDTEHFKANKKVRTVIQTEFGDIRFGTIFLDDYQRHIRLKEIVGKKINEGYKVIIFPEMIAGRWTEIEEDLWADVDKFAKKHNTSILLGVQHVVSSRQYDNALIVLGEKSLVSKELIKARVPMPLSNWNPFSQWRATLNVSNENNGVIVIADEPAAVLICYEQMLVWPVLQSMTGKVKPETIITVSNLWWAKDTQIPRIMENTTKMWGRLFQVPVLRAVNT